LTSDKLSLDSIPVAIKTVLLVDDDADVRRVSALALSRLRPWRVVEAASASEGLALAEKERPDLVLLDVSMPGVDGTSLFKRIRELDGMEKTPVIFVTAHVLPTRTSQLVSLGATGVITKPFVAKNLPAQIEALLEKAAATEATPPAPSPSAGHDAAKPPDADLLRALAEARAAFARDLPGKLEALASAVAKLRAGADADTLEEARTRAHKLAGSAGTHGLAAVSAAARRIEDLLVALRSCGGVPDEASLEEITRALAQARASA
jgi:two-component system, OmpR family, response regulator